MSITTNEKSSNPHVLIFPYPAQGHMLPLLDLTHQLSLHNITTTVITTPQNLPFLSPLLSAHPTTVTPLIIPFPHHPLLPACVENVKDIGNAGNLPITSALRGLKDPIIAWFKNHPNPPVAIVSDFFLGWTADLTREINLPRFAFFSSGAFVADVIDLCWNNVEDFKSKDSYELVDLPHVPVFRNEQLPSIFRHFVRNPVPDSEMQSLKDDMIVNTSPGTYGCIFNSFDDLESDYFDWLKKKTGHNRIFGVGPLSLNGLVSVDRGSVDSGSGSGASLLNWLDGCPDGSVLYVSFGSQKMLTKEQIEALALGLEMSKIRFVWVVKTGTTQQIERGYGSVPDGFQERVKGRGLVIKGWAPQVAVLNHRAVGGFLSHCGWNSVLESIAGGPMILAWPMEADQFINANLLVDQIGMAIRVCEGADRVPDPEELGGMIAKSMGESGHEAKAKAAAMRDKALVAVENGGSSYKDLNKLVQELRQLQLTK